MTDYLRASDVERHEVSELLARHFADGRLDGAEFDQRVGDAMTAKTRADLSALLVDLPRLPAPPLPAPSHRRGRRVAALALLLAPLLALASVAGHTAESHAAPDGLIHAKLLPDVRYGPAVKFGPRIGVHKVAPGPPPPASAP